MRADVLSRAPRNIRSNKADRPANSVDIAIISRLVVMECIHIYRSGLPDLWILISRGARSSGFELCWIRLPSKPRLTHTLIGRNSPFSKYDSSIDWRLMMSSTCFNVSSMPFPATDK